MIRNVLLSTAALIALSGMALAADLPSTRVPAAPPPIPVFSWTGLYVGGQIGYAFGRDSSTIAAAPGIASGTSPSGVLGGAHIGYNFEPSIGGLVLGVEGDVNGSSYSATASGLYTIKSPIDGSIRARAGFAVDRALFYATGGAAFASFNNNYASGDSSSTTRVGYTVGGGIEYALTNDWSVRAEYRYSNFGTFTDTLPIAGTSVSHKETENQVQAGFSYKFASPAPVVAKY
ncbi:MAG: porin family protein [Beijerinckiaceae bacterium]|nr:porin family protein [Beijerinckiaceae bacterium]